MIAALVGAIILIVLLLIAVWLVSPAFRAWTEQPKYTLLERNEMFEHAARDAFNDHTDNPRALYRNDHEGFSRWPRRCRKW